MNKEELNKKLERLIEDATKHGLRVNDVSIDVITRQTRIAGELLPKVLKPYWRANIIIEEEATL